MKNLILFVLLFASIGASAQNQDANPFGGVYYNDHSNYRMFGADVLTRSTRAAAEARTNVIKGDHLYDTLTQEVLLYNGSVWASQNNSANCVCVKEASLTIATADVLTLNSAPIEIVAAPGAGFAIEVLSASLKVVFNSVAYATNTALELTSSGADIKQFDGDLLGATVSKIGLINRDYRPTSGQTQIIENAALNVSVDTGNPTAGDSDIKVYVTYRIITL